MAQVALRNRIYYLCIEDVYAATVIAEWLDSYKEAPIHFRNTKQNVDGSFVLVVKDRDGNDLSFIERIAKITRAKVEVR